MSRSGIEFVGRWATAERRLVEAAVRAADDYLGACRPRPWVFEKKAGGEFSATQLSLFEGKLAAAKLHDLLEELRHAVAAATPAAPALTWRDAWCTPTAADRAGPIVTRSPGCSTGSAAGR